jgi:hypothetical protein
MKRLLALGILLITVSSCVVAPAPRYDGRYYRSDRYYDHRYDRYGYDRNYNYYGYYDRRHEGSY